MFFKTFPNLSWFFISLFSPTVARNCFESYDWQNLLSPDNLADCETYVYQIKITRCHRIFLNSSVSGKLPPPLTENYSLWKLPLWKLPPEFFPQKIAPLENPLPTYKSYKWKKKQNYNFFWLEESCAKQHPYQNNQFPLWYTDDLTENTGLRYLKSTNWKKAKNRQMTFTCTCPLYKLRRTKTRQSNYKIWEILETTK